MTVWQRFQIHRHATYLCTHLTLRTRIIHVLTLTYLPAVWIHQYDYVSAHNSGCTS